MKKALFLSMVFMGMLLSVSQSRADVFDVWDSVSRTTNYTINTNGSIGYSTTSVIQNTDTLNSHTLGFGWTIYTPGVTPVVTGYANWAFQTSATGTRTFDFLNHDPLGVASITKTFDYDEWGSSGNVFAPGETRTFTVSYSGPAPIWFDKSSNPNFPWVNADGFWEFVGDGVDATYSTFTVNVTLPTNVDPSSIKLLGWDVLPTQPAYNEFQFVGSHVDHVHENLVFKVNPVPVPPTILLFGPGLIGIAVRRRFKKS